MQLSKKMIVFWVYVKLVDRTMGFEQSDPLFSHKEHDSATDDMESQEPHPHKELATLTDDMESPIQQELHLHGEYVNAPDDMESLVQQQKPHPCKEDINIANDMDPPIRLQEPCPHIEHVCADDTQPSSFAAAKVYT